MGARDSSRSGKPARITWNRSETVQAPALPGFSDAGSGVTLRVDDDTSELDIFERLFSPCLAAEIARQTEILTDRQEIMVFLGLCMLMGHVKKSCMLDYWSTDPKIETKIFGRTMSRNRFRSLLGALRFGPRQTELGELETVLKVLRNNFKEAFYPFENVCIDETLFLWKGRLSFKQYISTKRSRLGIKMFVLADCETGYILDWIIYTGKNTRLDFKEPKFGLSSNVVLSLLDGYFGKNHKLYVDNWYSSPELFGELALRGVYACGTVRQTRKDLPPPEKCSKLTAKGQVETWSGSFLNSGTRILLERWLDNREVAMLSTFHGHSMAGQEQTNGTVRFKPRTVLDYNRNMGAVDGADMQLSFVETARKTVKWYRKLFFHFLDVTVRNAYLIRKTTKGRYEVALSDFRLRLIQQILDRYQVEAAPKCGRPPLGSVPGRLVHRHFLVPIGPTPNKKCPTRTCRVCSAAPDPANSSRTNKTENKIKKRKETRYICSECEVPLCVHPCMRLYHTLLKY